jgi:RimJ/RimL family protein N-acetyltransferase
MTAFGDRIAGAWPVELARLRLCPLAPDDAEEMATVLRPPDLYVFIGGSPLAPADLRTRYVTMLQGPDDPDVRWLNWVIRLRPDATAIGTVQATVRPGAAGGARAELAWIVGIPWQGHGYAKEAAAGAAGYLRDAGVHHLQALVAPGHEASAGVARAAGLRPTPERIDGEVLWTDEADVDV